LQAISCFLEWGILGRQRASACGHPRRIGQRNDEEKCLSLSGSRCSAWGGDGPLEGDLYLQVMIDRELLDTRWQLRQRDTIRDTPKDCDPTIPGEVVHGLAGLCLIKLARPPGCLLKHRTADLEAGAGDELAEEFARQS
jgi:hypothetical protein